MTHNRRAGREAKMARAFGGPVEAACKTCGGTGADHRYCMGWHTTRVEREVHGRCFEHCGSDCCTWLCPDCQAGNGRRSEGPDLPDWDEETPHG